MTRDALQICEANLAHSRQTKEQRRADFPFTTQIVDDWRAVGVPVRVLLAEENGKRIVGKAA